MQWVLLIVFCNCHAHVSSSVENTDWQWFMHFLCMFICIKTGVKVISWSLSIHCFLFIYMTLRQDLFDFFTYKHFVKLLGFHTWNNFLPFLRTCMVYSPLDIYPISSLFSSALWRNGGLLALLKNSVFRFCPFVSFYSVTIQGILIKWKVNEALPVIGT